MANGVNTIFTQMAESEDNVDALKHLKAGKSVAAASNINKDDSLYGSSEDSGDEGGAVDNNTASPYTTISPYTADEEIRQKPPRMLWLNGIIRTTELILLKL